MKIICIIDAQNDFIDGVLGTKEAQIAVEQICEELNKADRENTCILLTRDTHYADYLKTAEGKKLPVEHCLINTLGWEINSKIMDEVNKFNPICLKFYNKETFGSYSLINGIQNYAQLVKIESITFMGFCTDICVISNALIVKSAFPEIPLYVKEKCCAGVTPEKHKAAFEVMKSCQIEVI